MAKEVCGSVNCDHGVKRYSFSSILHCGLKFLKSCVFTSFFFMSQKRREKLWSRFKTLLNELVLFLFLNLQGVLIRSGFFYEAINDRNMQVKLDLKLLLKCLDLDFLENMKLIFLCEMVPEI